jgi:hypothetical protein
VDPSNFLIPDGLKLRGQRTLFESWESALTPPALRPPQENIFGEVHHNRDHSNHSPFLHTAPVRGARAPDAYFRSGRLHLYRGCRRAILGHPSLIFGRVPPME